MSYGRFRRGRWGGRTAATVVLSLLAGLCGPMLAEAPPAHAGDGAGANPAAAPRIPVQRTGSAADLPHEVGAEATEARGEDAAEPAGAQGPPPEAPAPTAPARSPKLSGAPQYASAADVAPAAGTARPAASGGSPGGSDGGPRGPGAPGPGVPDPGGRTTGSGHLRDDDPSVEVVAERTADSRTFRNADGSTSRQLFAHPVNYRTPAGDWAAIDTTLVPGPDGRLTERANGTRIGLARRADAPDLETVALDDGHAVRYALAGAAPVAPEVVGDTATYRSVLPGTDLRITALWNGVKEEFVLDGPGAAGSWTFPLHTTGLTPALTADGEVEFKDAEGTVRIRVPRGVMHDSAPGGPAESTAVRYTLDGQGADRTLTVTADPAWLHDPARVFPVVVDPTTTTGNSRANASTYVDDYSGANHVGTSLVLVGGDDSHHRYESYLSFGGVQTYANDYVVGAALHLYQVRGTGSAPVTIAPITGAWSPAGVNRTGAVPTGNVFGQYTMGTGSGWGWIGIDGPGVGVIDGCTHGQSVSNCGIAVRGSADVYREFASATSANPPYLQLEYTPYAAYYSTPAGAVLDPPVTNGQAGALSVEVLNHGAETWGTGSGYRLSYRLYDPATLNEIATGNRVFTPMPVDVGPNQKVTLNGGIGPLPPRSYVVCWDMRTPNGGWFSDSSGLAPGGCFTLDVTNVDPVVDAVAPPRGFAPATLTPVLTVAARDLDQWPSALRYRLVVGTTSSDWQASGTFTVPAGVLRWGRPTEWWVDVTDGYSTVSSPSGLIVPQVPQPVVTSHLGAGTDPDLHGIDPLTGNWSTSATDASVSTAGPPLAVKRVYNSLDTRGGGLFGTGWSSSFDGRLAFENGDALVTLPDGQQARFLHGADDSYTGPAGRYATLARAAGNTFELTDKSGSVLTFDANGRLTRVTDAGGFAVTHQYRADGTLETATSASGRALRFGWTRPAGSTAAHVTSVSTDPVTPGDAATALTWTYRYTGDNLTAVCAPGAGSQCTGYQYTATSHYRSQVADAAPTSYLRLGDPLNPANETDPAADEVVQSVCCATAHYHGASGGTAGVLAGTTDGATVFNGYGTMVTDDAAAPGASNQGSTELWFRSAPGSAGILHSYQNKALGAIRSGPPESPDVPALYVGTDGRLYGGYYDTTRTAMTTGRYVTDNAWHHVVLTSNGQSQELWLDGQRVANRTAAVVPLPASDRVYLGAGFGAAGYPAVPALGRDSYFSGAIDEFAGYGYALTADRITAHFAARAAVSTLSAITLPSGRSYATVAYDPARDRVADVTDSNGGHWKPSAVGAVYPAGVVHQQAVLSARPADYYRLDEPSGQVAHNAVHGREDGRDGTFGNVTLGVARAGSPTGGDYGVPTVAGFGATSSLRLPDGQIPAEGDFTVAVQFRTDRRGGVLYSTQDRAITSTNPGGAGSAQPLLYIGTDGRLRGGITSGSSGLLHGPAVDDNAWHTAALSWKQQTATGALYLDGRLLESGSPAGLPNRMAQRYTYAGAGFIDTSWPAAPADRQGHFQGELAELALWSRALTADEVRDTRTTEADYSGAQLRVTVTDPGGKALLRTFDPAAGGRVTSATDAGGGRTGYGYDEQGYLNRTTDPAGHTTSLTNDSRGNAKSRTTCRTPTWCQTSYTEYWVDPAHPQSPLNDRPTVFRDARSSGPADGTYRTSYQYDAVGNLLHTTTPATPDFPQGRDTAQEYSTTPVLAVGGGFVRAGMLLSVTTPGGAVTRYAYYRNTDLAQVTDPAGLTTSYTYDGLGRRVSSTETWPGGPPGGLTTTFTHDGQNRPLVTTVPWTANDLDGTVHNPVHEVEYDPDGNITVSTERDGSGGDVADPSRTTRTTYDPAGRVSTVTDPMGRRTVTNSYDVYGQPTSVTDPAGRTWRTTYTATGRPATTVLQGYTGSDPDQPKAPADLVVSSRAYDPAGRQAGVTDAMGRTTRYQYYDDDRLARVSATGVHNPDGSTREVELRRLDYDGAGQPTRTVTGGGANSSSVSYDAAGRVASVTVKGSPDQVTKARYDADGNPLTVTRTDTAGTVLTSADARYDAAGRITARILHTGTEDLTSTWTRDARGRITAATDPRGTAAGADPAAYTTEYGYDRADRPALVTGPAVTTEGADGSQATTRATARTAYNTYGEPVLTQDALGTLTQADYDQLGRPVVRGVTGYRPPGGGAALTAWSNVGYDAAGRISSSQDASRQTTTFGYDQLDNLLTRTDPKADAAAPAGVWKSAYDTAGEQLSATDPAGARTTATYDDLGRQVTSTVVVRSQAAAYTSTTGWDDAGNPVTVTDPLGNTVTTGYDAANRPVTVTDPLGHAVTTAYDAAGRPVRVTAADGSARTTAYDGAGRATGSAELDPAGTVLRSTATGYDRAGNAVRATDPLGTTTTRAFDAAGRIVSLTEPVTTGTANAPATGITSTYGYDAAGHRTRFTDGRGNTFRTTYNAWGLPESEIEPATDAYPAAVDRTRTTSYDAAGRIVSLTEPGGVVRSRTYDNLGRLTAETGTGAEAATAAHSYGYDLVGRVTRVAGVGGDNAYGYDDRGLLTSAQGPSGTSSFGYDANGQLTTRLDAAGTTSLRYDAAHRLATLTDPSTAVTATYGYNALDQVERIGYGAGGAVRTFGHDTLHRLSSDTLTAPGGTVEAAVAYGYDLADHLTAKTTTGTAGAAANTYGYDLAGRLTSWNNGSTTTAYGYDAAGNRTRAGPATAVYDARNRLLSDGTTGYTWTARGTQKTRTTAAGTVTSAYDAFDRLTGDGTAVNAYDGLDRLVRTGTRSLSYTDQSNAVASDGTTSYSHDAAGAVFGWQQNGSGRTLALVDRHTDVVGGFTATGTALTGSTAYDPFGQVTATAGSRPSLGYQSSWTDPDTGRANMAARWYDPATGAFTSRDTYSQSPDPSVLGNRYAYAGQDPLDHTDPSGHCAFLCGVLAGAIGGAVVGFASYAVSYAVSDDAKWSWKEAGWQTAKGAVTGAVMGMGGTGALGLIGGGAAAGGVDYGMECLRGSECTVGGAVQSVAIGAAAGALTWGMGAVARKIYGSVVAKSTRPAVQAVDRALTRWGVVGARDAAEAAATRTAATRAAERAATRAAAEAVERETVRRAQAEAAARAKKAAEEAARQRWLATPTGRASQAAADEGPDVAIARTRQAVDQAVPAAALPAQETPSLAQNVLQGVGKAADNTTLARDLARAPVGRSGSIIADVADVGGGRTTGGLGGSARPAVASFGAGDDAAEIAAFEAELAAEAAARQGLPTMARFADPSDGLYKNAARVKRLPGYFDVFMHGGPFSVSPTFAGAEAGGEINAGALAVMMREAGYVGGPVRLCSCQTGATTGTFAQDLANVLGVPVKAPTGYLYVHPNGRMTVGRQGAAVWTDQQGGRWRTVLPENKEGQP
ncbi:LamG-like jellyroll fold domain-containing protein [Kitasatospora purpeofusca]|uniref:DUF6531 domain-containing protein n=1 Tax=Kitasatospora purpeofusca TaxID=67352 RepID=A0ABZ1TTS1_9ACTN|nr:LamG-like jellyroll fold domain-containing protein [Kitasatospora purpeofusca]